MSSDKDSNDPKHPCLGPPLYDPDLNQPKFNLADLPAPPEHFHVCGRTFREAVKARKANSTEARDLVRFHGWGIDMQVPGDYTTISCFQVLWKLFYYQADKHRPQTFDEIRDFTRDAGPRLLKCSVDDPDLLPISRYYPLAPSEHKIPEPGFRRPCDALASRPDSYIEQMLYPASGGPKEVNNAPPEKEAPHPQTTLPSTVNWNQHRVRLPQAMARSIIEAVEQTILHFAYKDLARHPSAVGQDGQVHLSASTEEDLQKANVGSFPATAYVNLTADGGYSNGLVFSPKGDKYPYRGRGPIYRNNSSGIDSMIVVGKLLDAGSTILDRIDPNWRERFTNVEKAFVEATEVNWDLCSKGDSRDRFWAVMAAETENVGVGVQSPLLDMWRTSTDNFGQFLFAYQEKTFFCECANADPTNAFYTSTIVQPPRRPEDQKNGVSMQQLVARSFAAEYISPCGLCRTTKGVTCWKKFHSVPMRLAITLDGTVPVKNHTRDVSFDYITDQGQRGTASYRWLGGIYCKDNHYRVYWADNKRGEVDSGEIRMYDSAMVSGVIIGGIPQAHRDDKVPQAWWKNKPVPLIFYERIMNPDDEVINVALHSLSDMAKVRDQHKLLLQGYVSWSPSEPQENRVNFPWRRLIDRKEDRFHTVTGAYHPEGQNQAMNRGSGTVPFSTNPVSVNLDLSTSPQAEPEAQTVAEEIDRGLFATPTPSFLAGLFPGVDGDAVLPPPIGLQLTQPNVPPNGQHLDQAPHNGQYDTQHHLQPDGQYHGQYNTQTYGQQRDQFSTNNSQSNAQQQEQYNTQRNGQSNGQGVMPNYSNNTNHGQAPSANKFNRSRQNNGNRGSRVSRRRVSIANNVNYHHQNGNGSLMTSRASSPNHAQAPIANNFNHTFQCNVDNGYLPRYVDPSDLSLVPSDISSSQQDPMPLNGWSSQSQPVPQPNRTWQTQGILPAVASSSEQRCQNSRPLKRRRAGRAERKSYSSPSG
ncbi:hypothetical protein BDV29DRAFT_198710 [Aspergillus leporis]|uniref:Uncharacterized protein n=1 Tax=Aspergillus leporis TaxID=41062 RepID=A0A5N5WM95_9EURO|nr:hypothetical protein BDV29DRAFT_198710 [Aspergillus leporis]